MKSTKAKTKSLSSALFSKSKQPDGLPAVPIIFVAPMAKSVAVAGTFNDWQPAAKLLTPTRAGEWKGELKLPPGRYEYLFVVDGKWMPDPKSAEVVPNPFGGVNSVISVA